MRKIIIQLFVLFFVKNVSAQTNYCSPLILTSADSYSQASILSASNVTFATAINYSAVTQALRLDVYYHSITNDPLQKHPLIILAHGGGFKAGNKNGMANLCNLLAKKGYVTATIDYRIGWNSTAGPGAGSCAGDTTDLKKAIYRAVQDLNASIRYLKQNANTYRIDTNYIFIGGSSAGAGTCNWKQYFSQADFDNWIGSSNTASLGSVNSSGNNINLRTNINGICSMWGNITDTTSYIKQSDGVPSVLFHGSNDQVIPIDTGTFNYCYSPVRTIRMSGSRAMHFKLKHLGICTELNIENGGPHGVYNDTLIAERTACFFKGVICNACQTVNNTNTVPANCTNITITKSENINGKSISVFPNPSTGQITIKALSGTKYSIKTVLGVKIQEGVVNHSMEEILNLFSGVYIIYFSGNETSTRKIIIN